MVSRIPKKNLTRNKTPKSNNAVESGPPRDNADGPGSSGMVEQNTGGVYNDQHDFNASGSSKKMPKLSVKRKKDSDDGNGKRKQKGDEEMDSAITEAAVGGPSKLPRAFKKEPIDSINGNSASAAKSAADSNGGKPKAHNGSSIWTKIKQFSESRESNNSKSNQDGINLEIARDRVQNNDDAWLANQIYKEEGHRRRSPRTTAGKRTQ